VSARAPAGHVLLTVDTVIFTVREDALQVLLVRRGIAPFKGRWAIPGGFVLTDESLDDAARRELREETGLTDVWLEQLYTFGDPGRDPRGRVVTASYFALISPDRAPPLAGGDAADARWWNASGLPGPLAFDHHRILSTAIERLRGKLSYTTIAFELLPQKFTLSEVQRVYEAILGEPIDKRNFRKRVDLLGIVRPLGETTSARAGRPARLFTIRRSRGSH
jgi:ADP-ribose pyrophosphatase YjhB (NUDIX family)